MAITKQQAIDILDKFDFFQGQRAGRELWNDKSFEVQERDIKAFSNDVALLKEYISNSEVAREIIYNLTKKLHTMLPFKTLSLINGEPLGNSFDMGREKAIYDILNYLDELEKEIHRGESK